MCLIVDANVVHRVFSSPPAPAFAPIHRALTDATSSLRARLVYGGTALRAEYARAGVARIVAVLDRAGAARKVADGDVDQETLSVATSGHCQSNDAHIIALARIGRVRLLCSQDAALHTDFTNPRLLKSPRGRVYQTQAHKHLIRRCCANVRASAASIRLRRPTSR